MRPILFTWRGVALHSYPVMIYLALLVTVFVAVGMAQSAGLDANRTASIVLLSFIPAFIGARLFYVARHWDYFRGDLARILRRTDGGLALHGGFIGLFGAAVPLCWWLQVPVGLFMDALVLGMLAGIAVAKCACLLNGCCHGHATENWCGMTLPDDRGIWCHRFPSPLIEMGWALVVLAILLVWRAASPPPGLLACAAFVLHPGGRIFLQELRDEGRAENIAVRKSSGVLIIVALLAGSCVWYRTLN